MKHLSIRPTMTVQEVCDAFAATWPGLDIEFFSAEPGYYKDIPENYLLQPDCVMQSGEGARELVIDGNQDARSVRDYIYLNYRIEVEIRELEWRETLDAAVVRLGSVA